MTEKKGINGELSDIGSSGDDFYDYVAYGDGAFSSSEREAELEEALMLSHERELKLLRRLGYGGDYDDAIAAFEAEVETDNPPGTPEAYHPPLHKGGLENGETGEAMDDPSGTQGVTVPGMQGGLGNGETEEAMDDPSGAQGVTPPFTQGGLGNGETEEAMDDPSGTQGVTVPGMQGGLENGEDYGARAHETLKEINEAYGLSLKDYSSFEDLETFAELADDPRFGAVKAFAATNPVMMRDIARREALASLKLPQKEADALPHSSGVGVSGEGAVSAHKIAEYRALFPEKSRNEIIKLISRVNKNTR